MFFGSSQRQLFGAYHTPASTVPARGAAVLCPPWGPEYLVSHRILRRLAVRLTESGYHVLRFDYYGTGDSAGEREDGDLASWCDDASAAVEELRDMSGAATVTAFGIRLGAVVGWRLARSRPDVDTVLMWDPVVNGAAYVRDLVATQAEVDRWSLTPRQRASADRPLDLLGFPLTRAMRASVETVAPAEFRQPTRARVKLFYSDTQPEQEGLHGALEAAGTPFRAETMLGQTPWREVEAVSAGGVSLGVLERIVGLVA
jgi:alpha/beta superfamily hydrolase